MKGADLAPLHPQDRLVLALDVPGRVEALELAGRLSGEVGLFKVGLELFAAEGPSIVGEIARLPSPCPVFLDLKLHDVPATVERAVRAVAGLAGVRYLTVHAGGGPAMLRAAVTAAAGRLGILAVTVLTSLSDEDLAAVGAQGPVADLVLRRTELAARCGCAGVIASPQEAALIRTRGLGLEVLTPGVRPAGAGQDDQKRVATAEEAIAAGADRIVVGRPIRDAADPAATARALVAEIAAGLGRRA